MKTLKGLSIVAKTEKTRNNNKVSELSDTTRHKSAVKLTALLSDLYIFLRESILSKCNL
ncbi:hypothetical protein [Rodentibacter pneumotropicus]|uniref:hypothetical protein n=1 Tax=Rodentibacter pneumotropicus TaxID=758 RepID=UPI00242A7E1A|nr:hypothetical protein [Rodentibacter pneumotropicus]